MKKALTIVKNVLLVIVLLITVFMVIFTFISVNFFNKNDRNFFGYRIYIVLTDSMNASGIHSGDLIFTKEVYWKTLEEGDVITFLSQDPGDSFGQVITHKIRKRTVNANGEPAFVTYGTTTDMDDETPVSPMYILGKYQFRIPKLGEFFYFMKTPAGYILLILVPFLLLIINMVIRSIRLFRIYRDEQRRVLEEEKERIRKSKEETAAMLKELQSLKESLENAGVTAPEGTTGELQRETNENPQ